MKLKGLALTGTWVVSVFALSDAKFNTLIQTFGVVLSTGITAVVGYMGLRLSQATKRRLEETKPDE